MNDNKQPPIQPMELTGNYQNPRISRIFLPLKTLKKPGLILTTDKHAP
jgi:hypothetical protein